MTGVRTARRALAALLIAGVGTVARAGPGNGIRLGGNSARLHPYLELEGRYDSNIAYTSDRQPTSGFILHVRPGLTFGSQGEATAVDLNAALDWAQYLGTNSELSRLYGEAQLGLGLNRRGAVGLELTDAFRRSLSTSAMSLGGAVIANSNQLDVRVPFRPGGGAFVTTVSAGWDLETFEAFDTGPLCDATNPDPQCNQASAAKMGYSDVRGGLDLRWKFLPRTAALLQGEYWKRLPNDSMMGTKASGWRAWAGLAGLFSTHVAGTMKGGWGAASNAPGSISSWLANAEAEWLPVETAGLKLGYLHDIGVDPGATGGYTTHRGYANARALLASRLTLQLDGSYEHRSYSTGALRTADLLTGAPSLGYEVARWFSVGAGVAFTKRTSKVAPTATLLPGYKFDKTEAFVRLRGTY